MRILAFACVYWHNQVMADAYKVGPLSLPAWEERVRRLFRQTPNLLDHDEQRRMVFDQECAYIYRNGRWWNPWPGAREVSHIGQDAGRVGWDEMLTWPMVVKPTPAFAKLYSETQSIKTKPFKP